MIAGFQGVPQDNFEEAGWEFLILYRIIYLDKYGVTSTASINYTLMEPSLIQRKEKQILPFGDSENNVELPFKIHYRLELLLL